jgi:hypothetical protein
MRRRAFALMVLSVPILSLAASHARADLHCAQPTVDKGEVRSGTSLSQRFSFVNRGRETVEIIDVHPSCGCLTPKVDKRRLQPGETGTLLLELNTLTQPAGVNLWRVTIRYRTEGIEREHSLHVRARLVTEISIEPPSLAIYTDTAIGHEINVIDRRAEPLIVRSVQPSSSHVRIHLDELRRDDVGRWVRKIHVEVLADCPEGHHDETLHVYTSDPEYPELKVPFTVVKRARQSVSAAPASVVLAGTAGQPLPARMVLLGAADNAAVIVEKVECDHPAIACRWAQGPGQRATLKIRIDETKISGGNLRGAVHVRLNKPTPQTLTIPVSCSLR